MSGKRYKQKQKKNFMNFLLFYTIISIFFIVSYTLSRYVNTTTGITQIGIAKFNVTVNDIKVTENTPFELKFSETSIFASRKIAPDSSGYFEFIINPDGTEVGLEYEFKFNLEELDKDFKLLYFTINDSATHYDIIDNTTIKQDLLLPNNEKGFTDNEKVSVKVYWVWDEQSDTYNPDTNMLDNKNINILAIVKQKIK